MSEFIVYRDERRLSKTFNEVAALLKARTDLTVKQESEFKPDGGMFVIETNDNVARGLQSSLPGWLVGPNYKIGPL